MKLPPQDRALAATISSLVNIKLNPNPRTEQQPITDGRHCLIIDDFLLNPEDVLAYAQAHATEFEMPERAYPGVDVAIPMLTVYNWMVGMDSLDDEVVTILLNILANDRVSLEQVHAMAKQIDLDRLGDAPIPLHAATQSWISQR